DLIPDYSNLSRSIEIIDRSVPLRDEKNCVRPRIMEFCSLKDRTALLTVADSSTGIPLGECSTNSFGDNWEGFSWSLSATDLLCTVSQTNSSRVRFVPSQSDAPRSFSVRIQASRGPRCMSSIIVEGRQSSGCPPVLSSHGFSQLSLQCGCPYAQEPVSLPPPRHLPTHHEPPSVLPFLPRSPFHSFPSSLPPSTPSSAPVFPRVRLGAPSSASSEMEFSSGASTAIPAAAAATAAVAVHPCSTHVCSNGGRCTVNDAGFAECVCLDGFAGRHCENDVCAQVPCGNGGRCSAKGTIATCHCPKHTRGLLCEEVVCPTPCANGGSCQLDKTGEAVCDCPEGFTGPNCNVVDVCLGNAACSIYGPSAVCHIDEEATIAPRERLMRETPFECKCPQPGSIEWVDCISLHLTSPTSLPSTTPLPLPSSSSSISPPVVIPPLSPLTPHPNGHSSTTSSNGAALPSDGVFQPNPSTFNARPNPPMVLAPPTTTQAPMIPSGPASVPVINPNPAAHQFTFQTVIPPLGAGEMQPLQQGGSAAPAATTEQSSTGEMLPFNPPFFPSPVGGPTPQRGGQQVKITLPPPMRPVHGGSEEEEMRTESPFESTTAEGVAVPAAPIPVFPVAPNGERPDQQLPSTSAPFIPLVPHFPLAPHSTSSTSSPSFPQEGGAAIDAVEQTTTATTKEEGTEETTTDFGTMTTGQTAQLVAFPAAEERVPFESSSGSGFVASTMESTVDEWPTTTAEMERSTVVETTTVVEEEETEVPTTSTPFVVPPVEEEEEKEEETPAPFLPPATHPTTPPFFITSTTTTSFPPPTTTTESIPFEQPATPSVFSRPRVPNQPGNNNGNGSPDPSLSSRGGSTDRQAGGVSSATASWIVAIIAVAVLALLLIASALVVLRYVRQSRKLHGKYNPAREEHALSSAYAMPMATVTKEERLI
ncbi:eat-20, partial [Pristionchus pacificus]|uniref:Eat-20 n=1 Tax=Pristionchus pacificus TaxID=54126 RepID=A0A2A6CZU8_PRIPA